MNNLRKIAIAWNIMWGLAYIVTAFIAPNISPDTPAIVMGILGGFILFCVVLQRLAYDTLGEDVVRFLWAGLGFIEVYGGVASWTGYGLWKVPYDVGLAAVSMAFADLISAVFMFILAIKPTTIESKQ